MENNIAEAIPGLSELFDRIYREYKEFKRTNDSAFLVAISGIDASGKGFISRLLHEHLIRENISVALIPIDPWHHPQNIRFGSDNPGSHFYRNAFRWKPLFHTLILPLKHKGSVDISCEVISVSNDHPTFYSYTFHNIDVILLEGIFLFKQELYHHYDYSVWINCSFDTALKRAIMRNQEELPQNQIIEAYKNIYFPAQKLHLLIDEPQQRADFVFNNE